MVDPGVGTSRLSVVVKTKAEHYYVLPNNGLITLIAEVEGIDQVRIIDEKINRLKGSEKSNTFHGRDVFGYSGARLAAGVISWEQVGARCCRPKSCSCALNMGNYAEAHGISSGADWSIRIHR